MAEDCFEQFLFGSAGQEPEFQEAEFLHRKLDLLDKQIAKAKDNRYRLGRAIQRSGDVHPMGGQADGVSTLPGAE